jgi:DNA-binding GntR family transcriptional regulator
MPLAPLRKPAPAAAAAAPHAAQAAVDQLRSQTLVSICQTEIERMILDAELGMGARINELALAARLGISRGPVREACRSLVQAGLLETHVNRGFFVRKLTLREVIDLYDLRAGLMRLAGSLIAARASVSQVAHLGNLVDAMEAAHAKDNAARFRDLNAEFHAALVEMANNRRLQEVYAGLVKELRLFRRRGLASRTAMELSNREHRAIVDAIAARDAARTADAMEHHILQGKARFLNAAGDEIDD